MRKILFSILLASVAASPAFAQDHDNGRWHRDQQQEQQGDRGQRHEERQQAQSEGHAERQQQVRDEGRAERFNGGGNFVRQQQVQGEARGFDRSRFERVTAPPQGTAPQQQAFDRGYRRAHDGFSGAQVEEVERAQQNGGWRPERDNAETQRSHGPGVWTRTENGWARGDGDLRRSDRADPNVMRTHNPLVIDNDQRVSVQSQYRDRSRWASGGWNRDWRNDRRYDWRRYRNSHRSIFHIGVYFDPFGYGYQPFNIGYRLVPAYYSQQYWIDPAMYSLPYPPPGTEWVRYWNDALLIDVYSGEVVDVIHNFFW